MRKSVLFLVTIALAAITLFPLAPAAKADIQQPAFCLNQSQPMRMYLHNRFSVYITWHYKNAAGQDVTGYGIPCQLTEDTAVVWFFSPSNMEILMKVLDACTFTNTYWLFVSATTNVEVQFNVTDNLSGEQVQIHNPLGKPFPSVQNTNAWHTCP